MKKVTKIVAVTLIIIIVATVAVFAVMYKPPEEVIEEVIELPAGEPPQWQVKVAGNVEQEKTWTVKEISEMPLTKVIAVVNGENATYTGVTLFDFCSRSGMLWDAGPIDVIAEDGQGASLNIFQAWNSTAYPYFQVNNRITLVFVKNGKWIMEEAGGPVQLVAPYFSAEHQVDNVAEIHIGLWTMSVSGAVSNPLTISSENLTAFQEETVEAIFAPSGEHRTSQWTGLSLMDVLQKAGMSSIARTVMFVAIDGYVKNFTLQEVEEAGMLIGYAENANHLGQEQGGPYRLFCTAEKYKWAQFWPKFVKEIIVSY
jgi:DMSO/TMAO reductase YedYZ molybdopterin-dependent catalytic subunit